MSLSMSLLDRGLVPDRLIRNGIRRLLRVRLAEQSEGGVDAQSRRFREFVEELKASPIAVNTQEANDQHYELPPEFFRLCLGKRLKYSSAYFPPGVSSLDDAEEEMLRLYEKRADLKDGQDILELGCGWGSLTLWMAERFPNSRILGVSNSADQRGFIEAQCKERKLTNVEIRTVDMNDFEPDAASFDRVVSIEMFEHMKNYERLMALVAGALRDDGLAFIHIFTHRIHAYPFETEGDDDWMGRYFFTGGNMPSDDLLLHFNRDLEIDEHWQVSGTHYAKTSEAWLENMDRHKNEIRALFDEFYGSDAAMWVERWRVFYMACAELWGFAGGQEWIVSHYRFRKKQAVQPA